MEMASEKTVAIFGFGEVGAECGRVAQSLGMQVLGVKRNPEAVPKHQKEFADSLYKIGEAEEVLGQADVVLNVLPATEQTRDYFDYTRLSQMKRGAVFVNLGRGATVVEKDLVRALEEGHLKGAALDVFAVEPLPRDSKLWGLPQVLITPHYAGLTPDAADRCWAVFKKNLLNFDAG